MERPQDWILTKSTQSHMINSAFAGEEPSIYDEIIKKEKLFPTAYHFFALGLVYGILYNKKSSKPRKHDIIRMTLISEPTIQDVINACYMILDDGREEKEIVRDMLDYADWGVEALHKIWEKNGSFQLPILIEDAKKIWEKRVKELNNINLEKLGDGKYVIDVPGSYSQRLTKRSQSDFEKFRNIPNMVWIGLHEKGKTINQIEREKEQNFPGDHDQEKFREQPIWHNKTDLDLFVASKLEIDPDKWGTDKSKNLFYKSVANSISKLREEDKIIDWRHEEQQILKRTGIWRLR